MLTVLPESVEKKDVLVVNVLPVKVEITSLLAINVEIVVLVTVITFPIRLDV